MSLVIFHLYFGMDGLDMGKIVILDENTANQIAAGEVVERPASVVKELVENSIDAGSSNISIEINNGGISMIKVVDNGSGIDEDDVEIAFERHSTSKIRKADDLESIYTLGFRGEALASIASVSLVELTTRVKEKPYGKYIKIQGGLVKEVRQTGCPVGTTFIVRDLFYNTPARFKFLKKDTTEAGYVSDIVNRIALGNPHISIKLVNNRNCVIHTPGNNDLLSTIFSLYGKETAKEVLEVRYKDEKVEIFGYAGKPEIARSTRNYQSIYINGRYIRNKTIFSAIDEAYKTYLMKNKFAFVVLQIKINPIFVDVNVHPTKMEVRFSDEQTIFRAVYHAINNALLSKSLIRNVEISEKAKNLFKFEQNVQPAKDFVQEGLTLKSGFTDSKPIKQSDRKEEKIIAAKDKDINNENNLNNGNINANVSVIKSDNYEVKIDNAKNKSFIEIPDTSETDNIKGSTDKETKRIAVEENNEEVDIYFGQTVNPQSKTKNTYDADSQLNGQLESSGEDNTYNEIDTSEKPAEKMATAPAVLSEATENVGIEADNKEAEENQLIDARIIGQVFSTYILLQSGDDLLIIDQHAAHERIRFEELKRKYRENESLAQFLLSPVVIEITNQELKLIDENKEKLNKLGFSFENFGKNSIILRSVPVILPDNARIKESFLDVLDFLVNEKRKENVLVEEEALYTLACKAAVKANKKLDELEIKKILDDLNKIENPYTCPHGRPTIIKITKHEFEKMFKRIL